MGYAGFYLVRNNISPVAALIKNDGILDTVAIGIIANAVYISYGLSKFMMATLSDRANAPLFMPLGLALSGVTNILLGTIPALHATVAIFTLVMFINGWFQGMGWPPSGRPRPLVFDDRARVENGNLELCSQRGRCWRRYLDRMGIVHYRKSMAIGILAPRHYLTHRCSHRFPVN